MKKRNIPASVECACRLLGYGRIENCSGATNRRIHQCGAFDRAVLCRGSWKTGFIGAPEGLSPSLIDRFMADLVLWWDRISRVRGASGMAVFVPVDWSQKILVMLPFLRIPLRCYVYHSFPSWCQEIFPECQGEPNLSSPYIIYPGFAPPGILRELRRSFNQLDLIYRRDRWELSFAGLPVVWTEHSGACWFDFFRPRIVKDSPGECERHIRKVLEQRSGLCGNRQSGNFQFGPERWLESMLVKDLSLVRPGLGRHFYCQVPSRLDDERKVVDILAADDKGILVVLEVKTECRIEDIFQGLGYRARVALHLASGDFREMGYFRQVELADSPPVLGFVSPLFSFHRTMPVIWKYLKPGGDVFFAGINSDWRKGIKPLRRFNPGRGGNSRNAFPYS